MIQHPAQYRLLVSLAGLLLYGAGLASFVFVGVDFGTVQSISDVPMATLVASMMIAGSGYLLLTATVVRPAFSKSRFGCLIALGLFARTAMFFTDPVLEDDSYRYLFDGAVSANGINPYTLAPSEVFKNRDPFTLFLEGDSGTAGERIPARPELAFLLSYGDIDKIAYADVATIYPPVSQVFFALAYWLKPYDLNAWRAVLLGVDLITLILLLSLLKRLGRRPDLSLIYWLNPMLLREVFNAGHMDSLLFPFLLLAIICWQPGKKMLSGAMLAFGAGVKIWPVILAPMVFRNLLVKPANLIKAALPFAVLSFLLLLPQLLEFQNAQSGARAFAEDWQRNAFIFYWIERGYAALWEMGWINSSQSAEFARLTVLILLLCILFLVCKRPAQDKDQLINQSLTIIYSLFFLLPTGFPWYFLWGLPLLAAAPSAPILLLTALLPLYDLRFLLLERGETELINNLIIPLQFLPPLLWLAARWALKRSRFESQS